MLEVLQKSRNIYIALPSASVAENVKPLNR